MARLLSLSPRGTSGRGTGRGVETELLIIGFPLSLTLPTPSSWGEGNISGSFMVAVPSAQSRARCLTPGVSHSTLGFRNDRPCHIGDRAPQRIRLPDPAGAEGTGRSGHARQGSLRPAPGDGLRDRAGRGIAAHEF